MIKHPANSGFVLLIIPIIFAFTFCAFALFVFNIMNIKKINISNMKKCSILELLLAFIMSGGIFTNLLGSSLIPIIKLYLISKQSK